MWFYYFSDLVTFIFGAGWFLLNALSTLFVMISPVLVPTCSTPFSTAFDAAFWAISFAAFPVSLDATLLPTDLIASRIPSSN